MENWKEKLQNCLPEVEKFLTSVLLEETNIDIVLSEDLDKEAAFEGMLDTDIFLYTRDEKFDTDVIIVLDKVWYGLLSSIMLGVEEKSNNEITRDLLKKFGVQLSEIVTKNVEINGLKPNPTEIQVFTLKQLEKQLTHTEYFLTKMEIEGLADDKVRASVLFGNPDAKIQGEEPPSKEEADSEGKFEPKKPAPEKKEPVPDPAPESNEEFTSVDAGEMEKMGSREEVISGRFIEFEEFDEENGGHSNGDSQGMDMLKDVEMDVSVELGRIELPLGKVLQLVKGSVIELEKLAGEPVDILVNGHCIAHGEVVVIDEHFGVRVSNLVTTKKRIAGLN